MSQWSRLNPEVIVVDDQSSQDLESLTKEYGVTCSRIDSGGLPYLSRNVGASIASGDIYLFLDSKCLPDENYESILLDRINNSEWHLIGGRIEPIGFTANTDSLRLAYALLHLKTHPKYFDGKAAALTGNMLVRREVFEALKGFKKVRSGADVDFVNRARSRGFVIEHDAGLTVSYPIKSRTEVKTFLKRISKNGQNTRNLLSLRPPNPRYINMRLEDIGLDLPPWKYVQLYVTIWYIRWLKYIYQYI